MNRCGRAPPVDTVSELSAAFRIGRLAPVDHTPATSWAAWFTDPFDGVITLDAVDCSRESLYVGESRVALGEGCRLRSATIAIWRCQATIEMLGSAASGPCGGRSRWVSRVGARPWLKSSAES